MSESTAILMEPSLLHLRIGTYCTDGDSACAGLIMPMAITFACFHPSTFLTLLCGGLTMRIMTTIGFFGIVQKPEDKCDDTLTIRPLVKSDLSGRRDQYLSNLIPVVAHSGTDYQYRARATAPRTDVSAVFEKLTRGY